jgi:hypothetical protein
MLYSASLYNIVLGSTINLFVFELLDSINDSNCHADWKTGRDSDGNELNNFKDYLFDSDHIRENCGHYSISHYSKEENED